LNEKGVGLGLQISKELAILMGSKNGIQVKSTYGKGTTFTFSITNYSDEESVME
jgi:signal transduction histidine kinase